MKREIRFRGYQPELKKWVYGDLIQVPEWATFIFEWRNNFEDRIKVDSDSVGQSTGLKDKNGTPIFDGDLLRIKGEMGNDGAKYDVVYRVLPLSFLGFDLVISKLYSEDPDTKENSYPIHQSLSFQYNSLCTDSKNDAYNKIALRETWGENHHQRHRWLQNHYTNDVEVIGNIYSNPELLKP